MNVDPNSKFKLRAPVETLNLIERAFGKFRRKAAQRMSFDELRQETDKALRSLVEQETRRFAVGDVVVELLEAAQ